jgi:hypothetical protein
MPITRRKTNDPQMTVPGTLREGETCDYIVFTIPLGEHFELTCIANIPLEGQRVAPVYVKHKVKFTNGKHFIPPPREDEG